VSVEILLLERIDAKMKGAIQTWTQLPEPNASEEELAVDPAQEPPWPRNIVSCK